MQLQTRALPDESLAAEVMPLLLIIASALAAVAFGLLFLVQWTHNLWPYILTTGFSSGIWLSHRLHRHQHLQAAGRVLAYAFTVFPILTVIPFGVPSNPLVFFATLGVLLSAIVVSPEAPLTTARAALSILLAALVVGPYIPGGAPTTFVDSLGLVLAMGVLLVGTAGLAWVAAYGIHGTINWALLAGAKSERRERLLRETQSELEQALHERDHLNSMLFELNHELEKARSDAEAAYHSKATTMATMSHELRTPLNIIIGFSTAMLDHPEMYGDARLPQIYVEDISDIRRNGQHLLSLINDILDLARVEAGHMRLEKAPLPLIVLFDEVLRTASGLINEQPIVLCREYNALLPDVYADEGRIRQVLLNLLSNACKFTNVGEIALGAEANEHEVVIWIRDSGMGIARDDQERVFGQFERIETVGTPQRAGTGLGLAICRWLVELHDGQMWLESEIGRGSVFYFSLPLTRAAQALEVGAVRPTAA